MNDTETVILARIAPSLVRRAFATGIIGALGVLLELLAFFRPPSAMPLQLMLIALGVGALILCMKLYSATSRGLVLTEQSLSDTDGRLLATLDEIRKVDRGTFAFKPSNGFVLHLKERRPGAWEPGLWWRRGRVVGVGGAISSAEGRHMADLLSAMVARREA